MPNRPPHPCSAPGCGELTLNRFCTTHQQAKHRRIDSERGSAHQRGYTARWRKSRAAYLLQHPLCVECRSEATVVDHITPHKGDKDLFWDTDNWQPLCKPCHDRKTMTETHHVEAYE